MDLDHLETFLAIYRHQNLSRASEELHLSQPAVSNHLKAFEAHLGRPLFVRKARGVVATPLADSIAKDITEPLHALSATVSAYASGADRLDSTIYLGGPADALAVKVIPALLPLVSQGLTIHAAHGDTKELLDRLAQGELDLVIATTPSRKRGVRVAPFFTETLALVAGNDWAGRLETPTIEALREAPMIAYAENLQLIRRYWRNVYEDAPPKKPRIVFDDLRGIIAAVVAGAGWTVIPTYLAVSELADGALRILHQPELPPSNTLFLATPSGRNNEVTQVVVDRLKDQAKSW
jgi:DNA-binding transcriptional LysR family regulator